MSGSRSVSEERTTIFPLGYLGHVGVWGVAVLGLCLCARFNRQHQHLAVTVVKTFVANLLKQHRYLRLQQQRDKKAYIAPSFPARQQWAMDLTQITPANNASPPNQVLDIIDCGSRFCVAMRQVKDKTAITLLRTLLDCIEYYGIPKAVKTDNERCFNNRWFRLAFYLLGVKQ